jgi:hypothetical protein
MPQPLKEAYLKANPDPKGLQAMFERDVARMVAFKDIGDTDIQAVQAPALVINGDAEVVRVEHALALSRALPHARLAILPGGHGEYIGEICAADPNSKIPALVIAIIEAFLNDVSGHRRAKDRLRKAPASPRFQSSAEPSNCAKSSRP